VSLSPDALRELATRVQQEIFCSGKLELIDALYEAPLRERVALLVRTIRSAFPDLQMRIEHLIVEDNKVACRWLAAGTQRDWFYNIPPTEAQCTWSGTSVYVVNEHGVIGAMTSNWDLFGLLQQLRAALR
jgi:predicted ester cyclase